MKNFETLEQVISNAIAVHVLAAQLYKKLATRTEDPRARMLLEDMARHDSRMKTVLRQFADRVAPRVLATYLQYTLEEAPKTFIKSVTPPTSNLELEEVSRLGQSVHIYLTELFDNALRECGSEGGRELLGNLLQLEQAEYRTFSRSVVSTREL